MRQKLVLIIDDEEEHCEVVSECLAEFGYAVRMAHTGADGLKLAYEFPPDLVLLDISMPKMDGFEVLFRLRENKKTNPIPVIMLSGYGRTDNIMEAGRLKAVDFLIKPCPLEELVAMVRRYIGKPVV